MSLKIKKKQRDVAEAEAEETLPVPAVKKATSEQSSALTTASSAEQMAALFETGGVSTGSTKFFVILMFAIVIFYAALELSNTYQTYMTQTLKIEYSFSDNIAITLPGFLAILASTWIGDSYSGTFPIWAGMISMFVLSSLLLLLSSIPPVNTAYSAVKVILSICAFVRILLNVANAVFFTLSGKESLYNENFEQVRERCFSIVLTKFTAEMVFEILHRVLSDGTFGRLIFRFLELAEIIVVIVFMEMARALVFYKLRFEDQIIEKMVLCLISAIKNNGNPCKTQYEDENWFESSKSSTHVKQATKQFCRLLGVLSFVFPFELSNKVMFMVWVHQSYYLRQPSFFGVPNDLKLVMVILLPLNIVLSAVVFIPLATSMLGYSRTDFRNFGVAHSLLLLSLLLTYFMSLSVTGQESLVPAKNRGVVQIFNGLEETMFTSRWAVTTISSGHHLSIATMASTGIHTGIVNIKNEHYNYTKTLFAYQNKSTSYIIGEKGVIKAEQKGESIDDFEIIKGNRTKVTLISSLNGTSSFLIHKGTKEEFKTDVPGSNEKKSFEVTVRGIYEVSLKGSTEQNIMNLTFKPGTSYTFFLYSSNGTVKTHLTEFTRSNVSEAWQWLPIYISSLADALRYLTVYHMVAVESQVYVFFTAYTTLEMFLLVSKILPFLITEIHDVGRTMLITYCFLEAGTLLMYIKYTTYIDSAQKPTE